ncbi:hypothetical protein [Rhodopseudomonas pseudopalustris]|uniref:Cysteine rich repeat-containing protein n=1 Tax=Rhodopseudomonas pseudopalustris TaxID=1513892 RepID=A0A1H8QRM5_9BRAD|nr:hypothetical protein [Rhodopseudomonas pseudopalustris]SEO56889.1 hypothetical protein SAMN05444123_103331 [Rhodopseudomonas pseudopalustris]
MSMRRSGLIALAALLLSGSTALAQQPGKPCAADVKALCAGIAPGQGRIKACIKKQLIGLSQTCEERVFSVAVSSKVCRDDVTRLCASAKRGTGGVRACMKANIADVSEPCKDAMSRAASGRKLLRGGDL